MKTTNLYNKGHRWVTFGRDPKKPHGIIDTNQYMIIDGQRALLMDPGGIEIFSAMLASVLRLCDIETITDIFASHQDPDIISSLGLWDQTLPTARLHSPWIWESFLRHFGLNHTEYVGIPDEGKTLALESVEVRFIPAHYLHASGNYNVYDPEARILMSGDVGAALEADGAPLFVEDFDEHVEKMKLFHQRWMPSNHAKNDWVKRIRELDVEMMAPQHGRIFRGDDVKRFLDWFEALEVGSAVG
ncbi:MAG TPA: MBL fold metallo-hydrolase [Gammaproteobacteria bacterium]|nr:MBL fold metallo-hydrolase [Gammaproteobacteria bacterium]